MREQDMEQIEYTLQNLRMAQKFAEHGKLDKFIDAVGTDRLITDENVFYYAMYDLFDAAVDFFAVHVVGACEEECWYFSDRMMWEHMSLCQKHAALHHIPFKKDPYWVRTCQTVYAICMRHCPYQCWFRISKKRHHRYGAGLSIVLGMDFWDLETLLTMLFDVLDCYQEAVRELHTALNGVRDERRIAA